MEDVRIERGGGKELSGLLEEAGEALALAVVAHGAGGGMKSSMLDGVSAGLAANGVSCLRFNFPYTEEGRRTPDRPPVLLDAWRAALQVASRRSGGRPVVAGGKSLGGRTASMVASEEEEAFAAAGLVFFGYPLHAPGRTDRLRDAHLMAVTVPMLFIEGTADPLARFDLIQALVRRLGPKARLHVVEGGDHSFRVRGARRSDEEIGRELGGVAAGFVREVVA
jgi:predicted alpha/beta-hydrolase family hydrolase